MAVSEQIITNPGMQGRLWRMSGEPGQRRTAHVHRELEFNLIIAGRAAYLVEDRRYDLRPGMLVWLFPAMGHVLIGESADFAMWVAVYRPRLVDKVTSHPPYLELRRARPDTPICRQLPVADAEQLDALAGSLREDEDDADRWHVGLSYLLLTAWSMHLAAHRVEPGADIHPAVERAAAMMRQGGPPLGVPQIAERAGLSPSRLSTLFRQQTGVTLNHFRQRCCLDRFVAIYGRGRKRNLMQAALESGFGSYAQFHRVCKQHFGFGPAEYRRRCQSGSHSSS